MDADAVSRLLHYSEATYLNTAVELRDDFGPLSEEDRENIKWDHPTEFEMIVNVIDRHRQEKNEQMAMMEAQEANELAERHLRGRWHQGMWSPE
jgi:hypothetical protein